MTPINLMDSLVTLLKKANKDYYLTDELVKDNSLIVTAGYLPVRDEAEENFFPHIIVQIPKIEDSSDCSIAHVTIEFGTYSENGTDGWRELYNLIEHSRQVILKNKIVGRKYSLTLPTICEIPADQPYPIFVGFLDLKYTIAQTVEELIY